MSAVLATDATRGVRPTPFALDRAERLDALFAPIRGMSRVTLAVLAGSVALHLVLVVTAIVTSRTPLALPDPQVTSVEVVQETPKPAPKLMSKAPEKAAKPPPEAYRKPPEKISPPKVLPPNAEAPKVKPQKPMTAQAALPKVEPPKAQPPAPTPTAAPDERQALLEELAALRAQEAKLEARKAPVDQTLGMGPLPQSFQAVALPASSEAAGEAMDYKDIVFSQLAKAKGLDERMGLPGTAGVRFDVDAAGGLVDVEIVHPSGVAALDREALDIVRRAAPFPAPPSGAQRSFTANVNFVAQGRP